MLKGLVRAAALMAVAACAAACSTTGGSNTGAWMPAGSAAFAPAGFDRFCDTRPAECGGAPEIRRQPLRGAEARTDASLVAAVHVSPPAAALQTLSPALPLPAELAALMAPPVFIIRSETPATAASGAAAVISKDTNWALLRHVNDTVNGAIRGVTDLEAYGVAERWAMPLTDGGLAVGDCEDYALEKRRMLLDRGVSPDALFFAVGMHPRYGRHLVLVVSTDAGDYVLDNLTSWIVRWNETGYEWRTRQRSTLSRDWVRIEEPATQYFVQRTADVAG